MKLGFSEEFYNLMKTVDFSDIEDRIVFIDDERAIEMEDEDVTFIDYYGKPFQESPINAILSCIDSEIVASGLSANQNTVLPRGRKLYELYDSILYCFDN